MPKRRATELDEQDSNAVLTPPSKRSRRAPTGEAWTLVKKTPSKATPSKRAKGLQDTIAADVTTPRNEKSTPRSAKGRSKATFATPTKPIDPDGENVFIVRNADRSARRKSTRKLIEQTVAGEASDDELGGDSLAQEIWRDGSEEGSDEEEEEEEQAGEEEVPETPSKRGRGRPKGSKRKRTPTPPPNLPAHERYFFENRPSAAKSSSNTLSAADIISHSAYHEAISNYEDPHTASIENLHEHHEASFPLWTFELSQQFSVCLYGYGSKRRLLTSFATHLHTASPEQPPTTIIINGHHPNLSLRSVLNTIATAVLPSSSKPATQPTAVTEQIFAHLTADPPPTPIYLLISTIHTKPLTAPASLTALSQLASHPSIHLLATADNPSFPLLFPTHLRPTFNFVFHDATTFLPYDTGAADSELSTVVDTVLEMLGRKTSAAASREGVRWVLKSLPENARGLYRVLVEEILAAADVQSGAPAFDLVERTLGDEPDLMDGEKASGQKRSGAAGLPGVDAKMLYQKAVEEFLCSSEMMFWSLLKEFVDHRMIVIRRERGVGGAGEMLGVELSREELEGVLEDLLE